MDEDPVTGVQKLLELEFAESVFYRLAIEVGKLRGKQAEDKARELHQLWKKHGFYVLHHCYREFLVNILDGKVVVKSSHA